MNWPVSRRPRILLAASGKARRQLIPLISICTAAPHPIASCQTLPACAGSVATVKLPQLCELLSGLGDVKVVSTAAAQHFLATVRLPPGVAVLNVSPTCDDS